MNKVWYIIYITAIVLFFLTLIIGVISKKRIISIYRNFSNLTTRCGVTVKEFAIIFLAKFKITDVEIAEINGDDTNCYKSKYKALKFSSSIINSKSIGAVGICAHEIGHAVQQRDNCFFYKLREKLIPVINFFARLFVPLLMIGSIMCFWFNLKQIGIYILWISLICFIVAFLFYITTIFVEFNASKKVSKDLFDLDFFTPEEALAIKTSFSISKWIYLSNLATNMLWFINLMSYSRLFDDE